MPLFQLNQERLANNNILNEDDIKIGSKIKIKCQYKEKEIEINDYRFTSTNKQLDYTCIQLFIQLLKLIKI